MRRLAFIFWFAQILIILATWRFLPPQIPLFYSRPWGEEQITTPDRLLIIPASSLVVSLINSVLLSLFLKEEHLMSQILNSTVALFNFLGLIALIQIIRIVI